MASPIPFELTGQLSFPPDDGEPNADHPFSLSDYYNHSAVFKYELSGSGTKSVDFGSIDTTGAKAIEIEVATDATAPVMVQINSGGVPGQIELSAGGIFAFGSPNPTASGILSMDLVHTQSATVRVRVLG